MLVLRLCTGSVIVMDSLNKIKKELNEMQEAREKAIKIQRDIIPICAQAIRDIQKNNYNDAEKKLEKAKEKINEVEGILRKYPEIVNSVLGQSYQEFAELSIFLSYIKKKKLPELSKIPAKFYLLGLGDAIGELKRVGMELLAEHNLKEAEELAEEMEDLYFEFSQNVYPNAIVPGLKPKQDAMRKVVTAFKEQILMHKLTRP